MLLCFAMQKNYLQYNFIQYVQILAMYTTEINEY